MPSYPVKEKGILDGVMYDPEGKRTVINRFEPFPEGKQPSWVGDALPEETTEELDQRLQDEFDTSQEEAGKLEQDANDRDVSFIDGGGFGDNVQSEPSVTETL